MCKWGELKERYKCRRPKVTRIGEELYVLSRENGYDTIDTIEKQEQVFNTIFNNYLIKDIKLGDIMRMI